MTVLITGATGLIGSEMTHRCLKEGWNVHYLTTRMDKIEKRSDLKGYYWDPKTGKIDIDAFAGVTVILNLAGAPVSKYWSADYKKEMRDSRIMSTRLIYNTLEKIDHGVNHFISASGISVYPDSKTKLYSEDDTGVDSSFLSELVLEWEKAANDFKQLGIDVAIVRTGLVLDPKRGALSKMVKPIKMGLGANLGSGLQWQSWIHIKDVVGIYYFILSNQLEGVYNAVSPNPVTNKKLTKKIAEQLNRSIWLPNVPAFFLKLIFGEMSEILLESKMVSPDKILEQDYVFNFPSIELALEDLL